MCFPCERKLIQLPSCFLFPTSPVSHTASTSVFSCEFRCRSSWPFSIRLSMNFPCFVETPPSHELPPVQAGLSLNLVHHVSLAPGTSVKTLKLTANDSTLDSCLLSGLRVYSGFFPSLFLFVCKLFCLVTIQGNECLSSSPENPKVLRSPSKAVTSACHRVKSSVPIPISHRLFGFFYIIYYCCLSNKQNILFLQYTGPG